MLGLGLEVLWGCIYGHWVWGLELQLPWIWVLGLRFGVVAAMVAIFKPKLDHREPPSSFGQSVGASERDRERLPEKKWS